MTSDYPGNTTIKYTFDNIPSELKALNQWVLWRFEQRGQGKPTKTPLQAMAPEHYASTTNPGTWSTFDEAVASFQFSGATGIGFVFSEGDGYCGIDFDTQEIADKVLPAFDTYVEKSVSGRGYHAICKANMGQGFNNLKHRIEGYSDGRYFCFTGNVTGKPRSIVNCQDQVDEIVRRYGKVERAVLTSGLEGFRDDEVTRQRFRSFLRKSEVAIQGSGGDLLTYRYCCVGRDYGLSPAAVYEVLREPSGWDDHCQPSWGEELRDKVLSAYRNARNAQGALHHEVLGKEFSTVREEKSTTPEVAARYPKDGSANLAQLATMIGLVDVTQGAVATNDGAREVLREAVFLPDIMDQVKLLGLLTADPLCVPITVSKALLKDYTAQAKEANRRPWPHTNESGDPLSTKENMGVLLTRHGVRSRYNRMTNRVEVDLGMGGQGYEGDPGSVDVALSHCRDLAKQAGLPHYDVTENVLLLAEEDAYHPFDKYLGEEFWDGKGRVQQVIETLDVGPDSVDIGPRDWLVKKWLLQIVAAVRGYGDYPPKGVIVFTGAQHIGKTSWLRYLCPPEMFGEGLHLDPSNKDSLMESTQWLICELGEIDSTFKKSDINQLKAHIGRKNDTYRKPYGRGSSTYPRRTVYAGTVNSPVFLQDDTGNVRFWPVPVTTIDLDAMKGLRDRGEIKQFWLEVCEMYEDGQSWHLSQEDAAILENYSEQFRELGMVEIALREVYDWDVPRVKWLWRSQSQICQDLGIDIVGRGSKGTPLQRLLPKLTQRSRPVRKRDHGNARLGWFIPPRRPPENPFARKRERDDPGPISFM